VAVAVDGATFKAALGQWPSGVTVVTTLVDGAWHGMTASSFSSVSASPPLVSICLLKDIYTHQLIKNAGIYGINILAKDQTEVGKIFAGMSPEITDRFAGLDVVTAETGVPLLTQSVAWLDCKVVHEYDGGDHTIFVGEVVAAEVTRQTGPLLYHSRSWGQFADQLPAQATVRDSGLTAALAERGVAAGGAQLAAAEAGLVAAPATEVDVHPDDAASVAAAADAVRAAVASGAAARVFVRDAFAPREHDAVLEAVDAVVSAGAGEIVFDDTGAEANPLTIRNRVQDTATRTYPAVASFRLRDHAGLGLANTLTALKSGVSSFHATLGGIDGTIPAEDLLYLINLLEVSTDVDRDAVLRAAKELEQSWGPLSSRTTDIPNPRPEDAR